MICKTDDDGDDNDDDTDSDDDDDCDDGHDKKSYNKLWAIRTLIFSSPYNS